MIYILHISDLHFQENADAYTMAKILCKEAKEKLNGISPEKMLLVVTGDFHNFRDTGYNNAEAFLNSLIDDLGLDRTKDVFVVPGNHDVGNPKALKDCGCSDDCGIKQKSAVAALKKWTADEDHKQYMQWRMEAFRPFCQFVQRLGIDDGSHGESYPAQTYVRSWRGKLNILHLNTALIANGSAKKNQMTDTDQAANPETWKGFDSAHIPAIAIGHNSFYDLQSKQRKQLAATFSLENVRAYLCGDRHKTEKDPEQQMIRLESGFRDGKKIPNLVAARGIADANDKYSDVGFCWHYWDEGTNQVSVEFRKWTPENLAETVKDGETGEYNLSSAKTTPPDAPKKDTPSADVSENAPAIEPKDPDADLKTYLNNLLIRVRDGHPSFKLMTIDDLDRRLFPGIQEIQRFTMQGSVTSNEKRGKEDGPDGDGSAKTEAGNEKKKEEKVSPVWELIEETWKLPENHSIVMEGDGGIGKTVTLFSVTQYADGHPKKPALYIPLFDLVDKSGNSLNLTQYLKIRFPEEIAESIRKLAARHWQGPSLLLLLDGFNEIPVEKRYEILNLLEEWHRDHPGAQFIAVSRPLDGIDLPNRLGKETVSIKLAPLEKMDVQEYIRERMPDRDLPSENAKIWDFLVYPLFLTLYLKTEFPQETAFGYPLLKKEAHGPGGIIWNYLQRELLKIPSEDWVLRCAMACEYILPQIAYDMVSNGHFTIGRTALYQIIREAYATLTGFDPSKGVHSLALPAHLKSIFKAYERKCPLRYPKPELPEIIQAVIQETGLLMEYHDAQESAEEEQSEERYAFIHQHFRDCLAGVYLVNQGEMASENKLPEVWKKGPSYLALDYAAELMKPETAEKLWETNRKDQQYNRKEYVKNNTATCALLELEKRRNPVPEALNFSGMDLRGLSLTRYMGQFGEEQNRKTLPLFQNPRLTNGTQLDKAAFQSEGHSDRVNCMALLPDGRVVSGSGDKTLRVWDAATGQCLQTLRGHEKSINCVAVLPDGQVVSGSDDRTLRVWDAATGRCLQTFEGHEDTITCVAVLPDGRVVSGSLDSTLRVWNAVSGQCLQTFEGHEYRITCVAVLPDGQVVSGSYDRTMRVWDGYTGQCLQTLKEHEGSIYCVAVLPDGRVVSGSGDRTLRVWKTTSGQCLQILRGHSAWIKCVAVFPDGRVVSSSEDSTLRVWDAQTGQCLQTLRGHNEGITCVGVLPDGRVLSGSLDSTLRVWDATTGQCLQTLQGHENEINCLTMLPDGRVVSGSRDNTLRVWDAASGQCLQTLQGDEAEIKCVAFLSDGRDVSGSYNRTLPIILRTEDLNPRQYSKTRQGVKRWINCVTVLPDGRVVSGSLDSTLRVWNAASGRCLQTLEGHEDWITCVAMLPDGRVVSGSLDSTLRVWDTATGQCLLTLQGHEREINCVAMLPDGQLVSGSNDESLKIWDAKTGRCLQTIEGHEGSIRCVAVLPNGWLVSGSNEKSLRVWDAKKGQCLQTLEGHEGAITCVTVLPDGRLVSGSNEETLMIWDTKTGRCLQTLKRYNDGFNCVAVLPDGRLVSDSEDNNLEVWDVQTGQHLQTLWGHKDWIGCVAVLPDGRLISGSNDNTLRVWDAKSGHCLKTIWGNEESITCMAVFRDGRLISGSADGTLRIWDPDTGKCLDVLETMEVDVSEMDFSQACLTEDAAKLLWHNGAKISQEDYEQWVKPSRNP